MSRPQTIDHERIAQLRCNGHSWREIAAELGGNIITLQSAHSTWKQRRRDRGEDDSQPVPVPVQQTQPALETGVVVELETGERRITTLEDLLDVLQVDTDEWRVSNFKGNTWEQHSATKGRVTLMQVKALFERNPERTVEFLTRAKEELVQAMQDHAPTCYGPIPRGLPTDLIGLGEGALLEIAVFDAHFGMLAWGKEVGLPYDVDIARRDYAAAVDNLLSFASIYPVERILYVVGNDLLHADTMVMGRGGATASGTMQDTDSRLSKQFTIARQAVVDGIDKARQIAPVDVLVVPGNHDREQMYRMGEVLAAWYRNDPEVAVVYDPRRRKFYGYGSNVWMFTHGEEYMRQRESLPLIFADECPPELWVNGKHREIHTGHNHGRKSGRYTPTSEVSESRAIITRSLAALTPIDAWHYGEGYSHRRAATALVYRRSGGLVGFHEFNL